ncbi:tetratricopeptide repeat protein [Paenibacillus kribbensis]|uniref:tetratricopeptide repeat protein n=1 Tax=Paenibacillus kribbensis TaxID=172713 RepID=UPI0015BD7A61|nr:tetratricopeptide repeat protein [Paenibacillus kribbensis]
MRDEQVLSTVLRLLEQKYVSIEQAEKILEEYLDKNPEDKDAWYRLVILETLAPLEDYERAASYLISALEVHKEDILMLILLAFFKGWYLGGMDEALVSKLHEKINSTDSNLASIICYLLAWHHKDEHIEKFVHLLESSIRFCSRYVTNYVDLGVHHLGYGRKEEGKKLLRLGLENVVKIYRSNEEYDPIDVTRFINERITGVYMSEGNYLSIKEKT